MSEKVNFLRDWLGWIVSVFIAILGLILGISGDFIKNNPIYFVWICIIGLIFLSAAIHFVIYFYKQNDYEILYNVKSIKNKIINYSTSPSFPTLIFIGELESSIIQTIYDNHISNTKKVKIISTNSSSYAKLTEELKRNIFLKEAKDDDSKFIHKFFSHTQMVNIFIALNEKNVPNTIIFFRNRLEPADFIGILIKNSNFIIDYFPLENDSFSMNIEGLQDEIANKTAIIVDDLWRAFQEGFFEPLFPPLNEEPVRTSWRKEILKNFNDYAIRLIKSGRYTEIYITWNITKNSKIDKEIFQDWMQELIKITKDDHTTLKISRYLIINTLLYKSDTEYASIVDTISTELENSIKGTMGSYKLYYVCEKNIPEEAINDYAWIRGKEEDIIQSSIIDNNGTPDVLKIYFSKNFKSVSKIKKHFSIIDHHAVVGIDTFKDLI